jgi:hypothetical protein
LNAVKNGNYQETSREELTNVEEKRLLKASLIDEALKFRVHVKQLPLVYETLALFRLPSCLTPDRCERGSAA